MKISFLHRSHHSVLGYELINEPFSGDIFEDLTMLLPGMSGRHNLYPLYENTSAAIREVDDETIIFWEPTTWAYFLPTKYHSWMDPFVEAMLARLDFFNRLNKRYDFY